MLERHKLQLSDLKVKAGYVDSTNLPHDGFNQGRFERLPMPEFFSVLSTDLVERYNCLEKLPVNVEYPVHSFSRFFSLMLDRKLVDQDKSIKRTELVSFFWTKVDVWLSTKEFNFELDFENTCCL